LEIDVSFNNNVQTHAIKDLAYYMVKHKLEILWNHIYIVVNALAMRDFLE